jgi:hypothetical protein
MRHMFVHVRGILEYGHKVCFSFNLVQHELLQIPSFQKFQKVIIIEKTFDNLYLVMRIMMILLLV